MKNVIVYLLRSTDLSIANAVASLKCLKRNILPWSPADLLIFHETDFDHRKFLSAVAPLGLSNLRLAQVDFSLTPPSMASLSPAQRGYRHMCRFFANDIFLRPELSGYDYMMRQDDDSFILTPVKFNLFDRLRARQQLYAYRMVMNEKPAFCTGLAETAAGFFAANPALALRTPSIGRVKLYYTNFEICDLNWFRGNAWQKFFAAIDRANGIWEHRWGDAPIRWIGLQYLLKHESIVCLKNFTYRHQFTVRKGFTSRLPLEYARYVLSFLCSAYLKPLLSSRRRAP